MPFRRTTFFLAAMLGATVIFVGAANSANADPSNYTFSQNLQRGETSAAVANLQQYLSDGGYFAYPTSTGYFGPITFKGVKTWQLANCIPSTGYFGPISRRFANGGVALCETTSPVEAATTTPQPAPVLTPDSTSTSVATSTTMDNVVYGDMPSLGHIVMANGGVTASAAVSHVFVSVSPSATTTFSGASTSFSASVAGTTNEAVTWSASLGTINALGTYTAPIVYATTTDTITAQSAADITKTGTVIVTIDPLPITISISPTSTSVFSGATTSFAAIVTNTSTSLVTWSALVGTINASGTYTAPTLATSTVSATDTITAVSVADNTKIATASVTITNGLADEWPLNEGTGTVAYDTVNSANNGTWYGTPSSASGTYYGTGVTSSAVAGVFDGTDDYIDPSLTMDYTTTSTFTWSVWVDLSTGINGDNVILGDRGFNPWIKLTPTAFEYGSGSLINNTIPLNQWEFISVVKSGTSFYYYQNGALMGSASSSVTGTGVPFFIGTDPTDTGDGYSKGSISDARIYSTALTQSDIQNLYNAAFPPITISIAPTSITLASGSLETFDATVSNATNTAVTWSALYGLINASGTYTAPSVVTSSLTDIITATSMASSSLIATTTVTVVPGGMAVWLPLNEGTGAVANDISGNGNNGAWSGTMASASGTYYAPGIVGNYSGVFSQDGTTKISLTSPSALVGNAAKTISLWFNASELRGTEQDIAEFGDNTGGGQFGLDLGSDNHITGHLGGTDFESSILATTSTWYFAALTYNGSVTSLYVNGTLEATSSATVNTGDANFFIGQHLAYTGLYFAGDVDDVRVYTRALSQGELQEIYNATVPPITISISPTSTSLTANATTTFIATVTNASTSAVTWSAVYGTINASGTYTAPADIGSSSIVDTITATSQADNAEIATATITVSSGLVGWWPLNEGTGSTAYDRSVNGANASWSGTPSGDAGYYAADTFGASSSYAGYFYGGNDDAVTSTGSTWLKFGTGDFSVSFWMNAAQWGGISQGIVGVKSSDSDNGWQVYNDSGTQTSKIGMRIGSTQQTFYSSSTVAVNTWQLWTFVRKNGTAYWYLNGTQDATTSSVLNASSASGNFSIGFGQTWSAYYNGDLSDVRVYNRALSSGETQAIYNLGQPSGGEINQNPAA